MYQFFLSVHVRNVRTPDSVDHDFLFPSHSDVCVHDILENVRESESGVFPRRHRFDAVL